MSKCSSQDELRRLATGRLDYHPCRRESWEWRDGVNKIRARAPLRVSYAGGGTDVPPYPGLMGGVVLSSTIQNYAYCSVAPRSDDKITVTREDQDVRYGPENLRDLKGGAEVDFVRSVSKRFGTDEV